MSVNNVSPSNFIGGNWEPLRDRFLIGAGSGYGVNSTGGETTHTLSTGELPANFPSGRNFLVDAGSTEAINMGIPMGAAPAGAYKAIINGISRGGGQPHNNMPPYLAVYMWKRIS